MIFVNIKRQEKWLSLVLRALESEGCCVVEDIVEPALLDRLRDAMYKVRKLIFDAIGSERLDRAGEVGVLRLMLKFDPVFFRLLELPEVLAIVDATVSPTAILHLQNGFILPSFQNDSAPKVFQNTFHRDFPRYLNGYKASVNTFFALSPFTRETGATLVIPGSHQKGDQPPDAAASRAAEPVECDAGSMLVFDSTLWHAAGENTSGQDRLSVNQQFTRSWIKQQMDYVRALGENIVLKQLPRTQQLLGYYTRVVTSLGEYYQPENERLYRKGQG